MKKYIKIGIIAIIVIAAATCTFVSVNFYNNKQNYKKYLTAADSYMNAEQYDNAITTYEKALKYKNDANINKQIELAKLLKTSKEIYNTAIKQMSNKQYLEAIDTFKKVDKQDGKRYSDSQNKIAECKKTYIADKLSSANNDFKNNKFDTANSELDNILKLDANNADAQKLKSEVSKTLEQRKQGIRTLGELRKEFFPNTPYLIADLSKEANGGKYPSSEDIDNAIKKYGYNYLIAIGTGNIEDSDDKLVKPDVIINGKLAYTVWLMQAEVFYTAGNDYAWDIRDINGKEYSYDEVEEATNNNRIKYINGGRVGGASGHYE